MSCLTLKHDYDIKDLVIFTLTGYEFRPEFLASGQYTKSALSTIDFEKHVENIRIAENSSKESCSYILLKVAATCPNVKFIITAEHWSLLARLHSALMIELWEHFEIFEKKIRLIDGQAKNSSDPLEAYVSLRVAALDLDPSEITKELKTEPSNCFRRGDKYKDSVHEFGKWSLSTQNHYIGNSSELGGYIVYLAERVKLQQKHTRRWKSANYNSVFLLFWSAKGNISVGVFRLSNIDLLSYLELDVVLDCYI